MIVVSDTSPITALLAIERLDLLRDCIIALGLAKDRFGVEGFGLLELAHEGVPFSGGLGSMGL